MGRPRIHDSGQLLDAASAIAAAEGPAAVSMAGVAKATGTPSGSVYHRFPSRAALLGELWLRTVLDFQAGFVEALEGDHPVEACISAGCHVITWSRQNQNEARIFLRGPREFAAADWPPGLSRKIESAQAGLDQALEGAARRLPPGPDAFERVMLVCVDIPYSQVRRHLGGKGESIPATAEVLIEECAAAVLSTRSELLDQIGD